MSFSSRPSPPHMAHLSLGRLQGHDTCAAPCLSTSNPGGGSLAAGGEARTRIIPAPIQVEAADNSYPSVGGERSMNKGQGVSKETPCPMTGRQSTGSQSVQEVRRGRNQVDGPGLAIFRRRGARAGRRNLRGRLRDPLL